MLEPSSHKFKIVVKIKMANHRHVGGIGLVIPEGYYKKEKNIKLTQAEIDMIVDELERTEHNIFVFLSYDKLINKLKRRAK